MRFSLDDCIQRLTSTPAVLDALLRALPETWIESNEGGATWTPAAVVAHLVHGEKTDWLVRVRFLLEHGDAQPFPAVDRGGHARLLETHALPALLDQFAAARAANLAALRALDLGPAELARHGRHPKFGPVTLAQLLATWATHDMTHLHQLSRILAHQYREAVGPWSVFLGVLQCAGHSAPA